MTRDEYAKYQANVADFFDSEGITNLSSGRITCADCGADLHTSGCSDNACPSCGADIECMNEPSFSHSSCDCCGSRLGGDRYPASGYSPRAQECREYSICSDCVYYAEYGQLDDQTMMDMGEDIDPDNLDSFTRAYIEAMLWSTTDESDDQGGEPLDANYTPHDISQDTLDQIKLDCEMFQETYQEYIDAGCRRASVEANGYTSDDEMAGHDFWLTRNGHGAGFWDGDWPEPAATHMTDYCKRKGECWPYVGDDGQIYISN